MLTDLELAARALAAVVVIAVSVVFITWAWSIFDAITETRRHEKAMHRAEEDHQIATTALIWAQVEAQGPKLKEQPLDLSIRDQMWKTRLKLLFQAADKLGWHIRNLCPGVLSGNNWAWITGYLKECGILALSLGSTEWADGWSLERALDDLQNNLIPLPEIDPFPVTWAANAKRDSVFITGNGVGVGGLNG